MLTTNPIEELWLKYDKQLEDDEQLHKDDYTYRSPHRPLFRENGLYTQTNHELNINLSSMETFLIQQVGRFCDSYASDFLISWNTIRKILENPCPIQKTHYDFIGIREQGVDHLAYVISRCTSSSPEYLKAYYRKLYAVRIRHRKRDNEKYAIYVNIEIRDFTSEVYSLCKTIQERHLTANDFFHDTPEEKVNNILCDLYTAQSLYNRYLKLGTDIHSNMHDMNLPVEPNEYAAICYNINMWESINAMISRVTEQLENMQSEKESE